MSKKEEVQFELAKRPQDNELTEFEDSGRLWESVLVLHHSLCAWTKPQRSSTASSRSSPFAQRPVSRGCSDWDQSWTLGPRTRAERHQRTVRPAAAVGQQEQRLGVPPADVTALPRVRVGEDQCRGRVLAARCGGKQQLVG